MDIEKYHFMPEHEIETSRHSMVHQWLDSWWVVHPEKGLTFYGKGFGSPQCNRNETLARRFCPDWAVVKFFPRVITPLNVSDYSQ
jgi:hypothetical protein